MTITFPEEMRDELEQEARTAGFGTVDEYVLIMYHRAKHHSGVNGEEWLNDESEAHPDGPVWQLPAVREKLYRLIQEGLDSGPPIPVTEQFWDDLRKQVDERLAARR